MSKTGAERIQEAFTAGKAFIPFITCGDPDLETTAQVVKKAAEQGADLIELGIPFPILLQKDRLSKRRI